MCTACSGSVRPVAAAAHATNPPTPPSPSMQYGNVSASSRMRNLYAVSCQDNPQVSCCLLPTSPSLPLPQLGLPLLLCVQMYQCLGACLYHLCTTSPSGPDVVDDCSDGLMEIVRELASHAAACSECALTVLTCSLAGRVVQLRHLLCQWQWLLCQWQ